MTESAVEAAILDLAARRGAAKSFSPSDAAVAAGGGAEGTSAHALLPIVRRVAVRLALAGRIEITRNGKPADPRAFKGVWRMRGLGGDDT
jgi:hypothetical protein